MGRVGRGQILSLCERITSFIPWHHTEFPAGSPLLTAASPLKTWLHCLPAAEWVNKDEKEREIQIPLCKQCSEDSLLCFKEKAL